jgi:murein DD-endopeptidase MepM/ murein hydrolase activator NlpD
VQKTAKLPLIVEYSPDDRTIQMTFGNNRYSMMVGASQISRNGIHLPLDASPIVDEASGDILLPLSVWQMLFGLESKAEPTVESTPDDAAKDAVTTFAVMESLMPLEQQFGSPVFREKPQLDLKSATAEQLIEYMSFIDSPVAEAKLSERDNHLPGAPRTYRNGTHEGLDYYAEYTGIPIDRLTNVLSVADGIVVRVDSEYQEMSVAERNDLLDTAAKAPQTPVYILDKMRGRSIWVQYERGLLVRYAHLGSVHPDLKIGAKVARGQVLGTVGNSGTDQGALGLDGDLHLHMDMLLYGELFWQYLPKADVRTVLTNIF